MKPMYVIEAPYIHTLTVILHSGFSMSYEAECGVFTCSILWYSRNFKFWITLQAYSIVCLLFYLFIFKGNVLIQSLKHIHPQSIRPPS